MCDRRGQGVGKGLRPLAAPEPGGRRISRVWDVEATTGAVTELADHLVGERSYRLHVPPSVPAKQYWSVIAYDAVTYGFIRESPVVGLDSYNQAMQRNADGSIDLYFGPEAAGARSRTGSTPPGAAPGSRVFACMTPTLRSSKGVGCCRIWRNCNDYVQ